MRIYVIITWTSIWPGNAVRTKVQREARTVGETRARERERERKTCLQGCILIHSFALFSSVVFVWTIVALCIFFFFFCTLHIFTLEVHSWGGRVHTCVCSPKAPGFGILPNKMGTGRSGLPSLVKAYARAKMEPSVVTVRPLSISFHTEQ